MSEINNLTCIETFQNQFNEAFIFVLKENEINTDNSVLINNFLIIRRSDLYLKTNEKIVSMFNVIPVTRFSFFQKLKHCKSFQKVIPAYRFNLSNTQIISSAVVFNINEFMPSVKEQIIKTFITNQS